MNEPINVVYHTPEQLQKIAKRPKVFPVVTLSCVCGYRVIATGVEPATLAKIDHDHYVHLSN